MKKFLFLFVALVTAMPTFAQSDDDEDVYSSGAKVKKNAFFIGPKVGGVLTTMTQPKQGKLYDAAGFGFSGGLAMKIRFGQASEASVGGTGYFAIGAELKYKQNKVKTLGTDQGGKKNADLTISYFEVPVFAQVYPFATSMSMNTLYFEAGASIAGTMDRKPNTLEITDKNTLAVTTFNIDNNGSKVKGMDVRPIVGLGYTIPNTGLDINARYYIGTSDLSSSFKSKMNSFEVSLAWLFNASRF